MVENFQRSIKKMMLDDGVNPDVAMPRALFGYRRRPLKEGPSPFQLLYGVVPRLPAPKCAADTLASGGSSTISTRQSELLAIHSARATQIVNQTTIGPRLGHSAYRFNVSDDVLIAYEADLTSTMKWLAFKSSYYDPWRVVKARHLRYTPTSLHGRHYRRDVHACPLLRSSDARTT